MTTGDPTIYTTSTGNGNVATSTTYWPGLTTAQVPNTTWGTIDPFDDRRKLAKVEERLKAIEERLCILRIDEEMLVKHPALKEAYEAYRIIEGLIGKDEKR